MVLDDIGHPRPVDLARALDVPTRTATAWCSGSADPPRVAQLALFWLTRWGQSVVDCDAVNAASLAAQRLACAEREISRLRAELARVLTLADFGSANAPIFDLVAERAALHAVM